MNCYCSALLRYFLVQINWTCYFLKSASGVAFVRYFYESPLLRCIFDLPTAVQPLTAPLSHCRTTQLSHSLLFLCTMAQLPHFHCPTHLCHTAPLPVPLSWCLTDSLPTAHCLSATLPHCRTATLPHCPTASLPHCPTASLTF